MILSASNPTGSQASCSVLCKGAPRFTDANLAKVAKTEGIAAAWLAAFQRDGVHCPAGVNGDFAVAIRDAQGRVFLAVDRFATRTLCYRQDGNRLLFAHRADELINADCSRESQIDPQAIFDYLFFHVIPSPRTIFKQVMRLPPAHYALFEAGELKVAPYWVATFDEDHHTSFDSLRNEFRQILKDAVTTQLGQIAPDKVGCFLSGGTDSSTVVGMLTAVGEQPANSYSIGFDAAGYDEMAFARIAAKHFKTKHHEYYVTPDDLVRSIAEVAAHYDQPFGNSSALPAFYCAKMAKADGREKMLAGDGGDELFGGNSRYAKQRVFGWYQHLPPQLRSGVMEPFLELESLGKVPLLRKAASYVEQAKVPMPDRLHMYNLLLRLGIDNVLTPAFLAQVDINSPAQQQRDVWALTRSDIAIDQVLAFDWRYTLAENDLPKVCGTTQLAGIGVGFPMLDERLLAFSLKLPAEYKLKGLKLRWFFKEALRGFLPDEIITKKKQGFGLPFGVWATQHAGLRALATDSLQHLAGRGIVRPEFITSLLNEKLAEHPGYYGEMVWILMMLEQWLHAKAPQYRLA
ncbi:asparagine synthetase B family protein [Chitinimonas sp. PSY-7]|uniref:asparagine synthase-related protein n=1 Tax=Chitinimonas sp. PSY-7 TaxID=3459088 RepID=UPI00403FF873